MISRRAVLLGAGAACVHAAGTCAGQIDPAGVLTASDVHVAYYPTVLALRWMGEMISRESGGDLGMRVYHSGQLGRENDTVDLARFGALDITRINFASLNNAFPATQAPIQRPCPTARFFRLCRRSSSTGRKTTGPRSRPAVTSR